MAGSRMPDTKISYKRGINNEIDKYKHIVERNMEITAYLKIKQKKIVN